MARPLSGSRSRFVPAPQVLPPLALQRKELLAMRWSRVRCLLLLFSGLFLLAPPVALAWDKLEIVPEVPAQPLQAQAERIRDALQSLGQPLTEDQQKQLALAVRNTDEKEATKAIQEILDPLCLAEVHINPESRVKVAAGPVDKELFEQGWRVFLVKVRNEAGVTAPLAVKSPNAEPIVKRSSGSPDPKPSVLPSDVPHRWMDVEMFNDRPLVPGLSGLAVEYRIVQLYSRDRGQREALLAFDVGQGTADLGYRNAVPILFRCQPASEIKLEIYDFDGTPTTGQFVIRDPNGRVYPSRARRLAPDFFFHDQIYRHHGESITLPPGSYEVTYTRGPEYRIEKRPLVVSAGQPRQTERFDLKRWIHLQKHNWISGDHHVHAAGCSHYEAPTQGVTPEVMMRHILGEDLAVGCVLTWGPCWYYQKQFFDGKVHNLSQPGYIMRYDIEVSGFPSSHTGHLCLLRLQEDDYPGTTKIEEWPSWDLPVLKWGKAQGGVVGFSHSGWGLEVPAQKLPTHDMPAFDGIGANEYIVDVVHDAVDFISTVDTPAVSELNIWYHTLNCGYQCRISGETDFPCIYDERVGLGRVYVHMPSDKPIDFDGWVKGIRDGRSYVCEGLSHLMDFQVNGLAVGTPGHEGRMSTLSIAAGQPLRVQARAAALLEETPREDIRKKSLLAQPYWHVERSRVGNSRKVPAELIVNGESVETIEIEADGSIQNLQFQYQPKQSSWVALRIFPAAHTNPVFVEVDGKPIRASRRSAQWCLDAVDVCWKQKEPKIREADRPEAAAAYDLARKAYTQILKECQAD
jgi:hypothetical protein